MNVHPCSRSAHLSSSFSPSHGEPRISIWAHSDRGSKLSPIVKGLLQRGLMRVDTSQHLPRLFFTEAGLAELRRMMADRRFADPKKFGHIRQELGIDPMSDAESPPERFTDPVR
jgi:hypothetical protein